MRLGNGLIYLLSARGRAGDFLRIGPASLPAASGYGLNYGASYGG